jgi:hypothetical protein
MRAETPLDAPPLPEQHPGLMPRNELVE